MLGLETLARDGAIVERRAVDPNFLSTLCRLQTAAVALLNEALAGGDNPASRCLVERHTLTHDDADNILGEAGAFYALADAIARPLLSRLGLGSATRSQNGGVFIADAHLPNASFHWHMDGHWDGLDELGVSFWIPLRDCGADAPGIAFARVDETRRDEVLRCLPQSANPLPADHTPVFWPTVTDEHVGRFGPIEAPTFAVGDVLIFTNGTLHRTHVGPAMRARRCAMIARYAMRGATRVRHIMSGSAVKASTAA